MVMVPETHPPTCAGLMRVDGIAFRFMQFQPSDTQRKYIVGTYRGIFPKAVEIQKQVCGENIPLHLLDIVDCSDTTLTFSKKLYSH